MGCSSSKPEVDESLNESIELFQKSLPLSRVSTKSAAEFISKSSFSKSMTRNQLVSLCRHLHLPLTSKDLLIFHYTQKLTETELSTSKILTLVVILSKGTKEQKIRLLFEIYSMWSLGGLQEKDVKSMITNIFDISVDLLLKFSMIYDKSIADDDVKHYMRKLNYEKSTVILYFYSLIMGENNVLQLNKFEEVFNRMELSIVMKPRLVRMLAYKMYKTGDKLKSSDDETCPSMSDLDYSLLQKYSKKISVL
jgi:hypothetical protein